MATKQRVRKLELERSRRAAEVGQRIVRQLTDSELAALAVGFEQFTDAELEAIAAGAFVPLVEMPPIDPALLARLSELCDDDGERRLLGLPV
jgi:hypothetical protein